ncbi:MAG: KEOPS complex subunit Cgi121 [Promethearchaeota archaeon]
MIAKEFRIHDLNLHYYVGINQIRIQFKRFVDFYNLDNESKTIDQFFSIIEEIQHKNENSVIQFINDKYILNQDHIFTACYYLEKAFLQDINISNKKNIEFLLYLATNRQIHKSIEGFGISFSDLSKNRLTYCIISPLNNLDNISVELSSALNAEEEELTINDQSTNKINLIKNYFEITDSQLNSVLKSYGIIADNSDISLSSIVSALYDLICEKMALLHIEKAKNAK